MTAKALPVQHVLWHFGDLKCGLNDLLAAKEENALVTEPIEEDETQIQLLTGLALKKAHVLRTDPNKLVHSKTEAMLAVCVHGE